MNRSRAKGAQGRAGDPDGAAQKSASANVAQPAPKHSQPPSLRTNPLDRWAHAHMTVSRRAGSCLFPRSRPPRLPRPSVMDANTGTSITVMAKPAAASPMDQMTLRCTSAFGIHSAKRHAAAATLPMLAVSTPAMRSREAALGAPPEAPGSMGFAAGGVDAVGIAGEPEFARPAGRVAALGPSAHRKLAGRVEGHSEAAALAWGKQIGTMCSKGQQLRADRRYRPKSVLAAAWLCFGQRRLSSSAQRRAAGAT